MGEEKVVNVGPGSQATRTGLTSEGSRERLHIKGSWADVERENLVTIVLVIEMESS